MEAADEDFPVAPYNPMADDWPRYDAHIRDVPRRLIKDVLDQHGGKIGYCMYVVYTAQF